jgi:hypothetical protein
MKRAVAFGLALLIVVIGAALNRSNAQPQQQSVEQTTVRLHRVRPANGASIKVQGRIVGFSCVENPTVISECFVATAD